MMCPFLSKTNPDPTPPPLVSSVSPHLLCTFTLTTPGSDFSNISINDKLVRNTGDGIDQLYLLHCPLVTSNCLRF